MLAINRFVTLLNKVFVETTNKPKEFPNIAMMKITAYAEVMPIFTFVEIAVLDGGIVEFRS